MLRGRPLTCRWLEACLVVLLQVAYGTQVYCEDKASGEFPFGFKVKDFAFSSIFVVFELPHSGIPVLHHLVLPQKIAKLRVEIERMHAMADVDRQAYEGGKDGWQAAVEALDKEANDLATLGQKHQKKFEELRTFYDLLQQTAW